MPLYRLDIYNAAGAVHVVARLDYDDDAAAIQAVERHSQNHRMELWDGERLVKRFEAGEPPADWTDPL